MGGIKVLINPIWPWPTVLLTIGALLALVLWTYPPRVRHLPPFQRRLLLGLRLLAVVALAFAMLRPEVQRRDSDKQASVIAVLADASRSMTVEDGVGGVTRREALLKVVEENQRFLEALGEEIEVRYFNFAEELTPVEDLSPEAEGAQTAIGSTLDSLLRETSKERLVSVLMLSDFAQRALPPRDEDPRGKARQLGQQGVHIHTVGFGGSGFEGAVDTAVEDLLVDPLVFEKKVVPISAKVRAVGAQGRKLQVRLLVEDRSGRLPGVAGEMVVPSATRNTRPTIEVTPKTNDEVIPVELSYVPELPGEFKIAVEVQPLEGELKPNNNTVSTIITVQKGGINIALFDRELHTEQKWIRLVNTSDKIQVDFVPVRAGPLGGRTSIDPQMFEPGRYDAYIIGDVPADVFGNDLLRQMARAVEEGAGLLMIGGYRSFGPGGYAETPLAELLPVLMSPAEKQIGLEIDPSLHYEGELQMLPTEPGLRHFVMRLENQREDNRQRWMQLSKIEGANRLRKKNEAVEVLAQTEDGIPLLFSIEAGPARIMAAAVDTTWQWVLAGHADEHQRFWRQMILWLSHKEMDGDQPVWARAEPRNFQPGQRATITFGARTLEGEPIPDADFTVEIRNPEGETSQLPARRAADAHEADFVETRTAGDYWVRVSARKDGQSLGPDAWTRFIVDSRDLEMDNPAADRSLMEAIAQETGGSSLLPEELGSFLKRMVANPPTNAAFDRVTSTRLWDNWFFLGVFVGVMSLEWYLRKRRGLV